MLDLKEKDLGRRHTDGWVVSDKGKSLVTRNCQLCLAKDEIPGDRVTGYIPSVQWEKRLQLTGRYFVEGIPHLEFFFPPNLVGISDFKIARVHLQKHLFHLQSLGLVQFASCL